MGIPTKMFRDAAVAEIVLVSAAHHRVFQYVIANIATESFVVISEWII
jgi:hypothetical protein